MVLNFITQTSQTSSSRH